MPLNPQSQERLRAVLIDLVPVGVVVWSLEDADDPSSLSLLYANPAACRLAHLDLESGVGKPIRKVVPGANTERMRKYAAVCLSKRTDGLGVLELDGDASLQALSVLAIPVLERCVALVFEDAQPLRRAQRDAEQSRQFLDSIIEQVPAMIFMKAASDLRFTRFNRAGEELLGLPREALIGKNDYDFFPKEQADAFVAKDREVLAKCSLHDIPEEPIQTPEGTRWLHTRKIPLIDSSGVPQHLLGISLDITEKRAAAEVIRLSHDELARCVAERTQELERQIEETKRAQAALAQTEAQLRQAQKMEAIGRLAGGIAHDFNNLLSVVLGYADLALLGIAPTSPAHGQVEQIREAGIRAAGLTRQLLTLSRQQVIKPQVLDIGQIISQLEPMLRRLLGEDIELRVLLSPSLGLLNVDPSQMEQVIMNLVVNARDAMPTGGSLTIEVCPMDLDEDYAAQHLGTVPGPHVMLAVSDTGGGMSKEVLAQAFEPFFTTKAVGKGTGLGLSTVFGIVKHSGGSVWAYSEVGTGSTFKVYLPVTQERATKHKAEPPKVNAFHGRETVLVVEDDTQVRALACAALERYGYQVLEAKRPSEALRIGAEHEGKIHALVTDVVMPEMGGRALAQKLVEMLPDLRVLFMSGYTDDAVVRHGVLQAELAFVQKPLTPELLARSLRAVLDSSG